MTGVRSRDLEGKKVSGKGNRELAGERKQDPRSGAFWGGNSQQGWEGSGVKDGKSLIQKWLRFQAGLL